MRTMLLGKEEIKISTALRTNNLFQRHDIQGEIKLSYTLLPSIFGNPQRLLHRLQSTITVVLSQNGRANQSPELPTLPEILSREYHITEKSFSEVPVPISVSLYLDSPPFSLVD